MKKRILFIFLALALLAVIFLVSYNVYHNEWKRGYESGYRQCQIENEVSPVSIEKVYEEEISSEKEDEIYNRGYNDGLNDPMNYEKGYADGYEACLSKEEVDMYYVCYSGKFTAKVVCLLEDNYEIEGKSVAYLSSMYKPFIVYFDRDMTGELEEGKEYVFEIEPFSFPYIVGTNEYHFEEFTEKLRVTSFYEASDNEKGRNGLWILPEYYKEDPLSN